VERENEGRERRERKKGENEGRERRERKRGSDVHKEVNALGSFHSADLRTPRLTPP
jgi:hypothetical protein